MNKSFTILVFLALILGAGSIYLIKKIIDVERQKAISELGPKSGAPTEAIKMGDIFYVKEDLQTGTALTEVNVAPRKVPEDAIPETAVRSMDELKDQFAFQPLFKGEWLLKPKIRSRDNLPKASLMIEPGKRLISVRVDEVKANSYLIKNGDYVDLVGSFNIEEKNLEDDSEPPFGNKITVTFLQRVKVFDIVNGITVPANEEAKDDPSMQRMAMGTNATFEVTAREAEIITNAESIANSIWLVLRRFDDTAVVEPTNDLEKKIIADLIRDNKGVAKAPPPVVVPNVPTPPPAPVQQRKTVF